MNPRIVLLFPFLLGVHAFSQSDSTFFVDGRYLYDPCGNQVILRGANAMVVYWDRHGDNIYPELSQTGANCCRIFWSTGHDPEPVMPAADLDTTLQNCWDNNMIPMPSVWDATGDWSQLDACVDYWLRTDVLAVLKSHEKHLILNIANEPGSDARSDFASKYESIVQRIRDADLHCPLVIDADGWGRNAWSVIDNGPYLVEQDPDHNLIFSWHVWDPGNWGLGSQASITSVIDSAVSAEICFIVGEFGPCEQCDNCAGTAIEWEHIIQYSHQNDIGFLPWVWRWDDCHGIVSTGNDDYGNWANSPWGEGVAVSNTYSIQNTAQRTEFLESGECPSTATRGRVGSVDGRKCWVRHAADGGWEIVVSARFGPATVSVFTLDGAGVGSSEVDQSGVVIRRGGIGGGTYAVDVRSRDGRQSATSVLVIK